MNPIDFKLLPMILLENRNHEYNFCLEVLRLKQYQFLEFGVWEGKSINYFAKYLPKDKIIHGFDTFEGLPEAWDMGHKVIPKGYFKVNSLPKVEKNIILHKGLFHETIPKWKKIYDQPIGFINIDCDLYLSTKDILFSLNDLIIKDTMIRFDDFFHSPISPYPKWQEGSWKALNEWVVEKNRLVYPIARSWKNGCTIFVEK